MKKITLTLALILTTIINLNAQDSEKQKAEKYISTQGELTFTFQVDNHNDVEEHTKDLSLVNYDPNTKTVIAWANEKQFRAFEDKRIPFQVPVKENEVIESEIYDVTPLTHLNSRRRPTALSFPVNVYPTYEDYAYQMQLFQDDNPALVETFSIGDTGQGDKEILFVKISDNVGTDEQEPKLMLTSSMHGDEIAGYPMMLSLIDYILTVYADTGHADHARVKNLVENAEIWINPSANPDGTYHNSSSNTSVVNARRGNGNNVDLNRNYPDNVQGAHTDGEVYQTETLAFMCLAEANHFVVSANFHGGTELVNYPFDNAYVSQYTHPDGGWFEDISVEYATHAQTDANSGSTGGAPYAYKASYMTADDDSNVYPSPGVTHGAEWYRVYGGRQDYMNVTHQCKEVTIELSDQKILSESSLDDYWYYNRDALLDFLTQGTYGFRGVVKDASTGDPIEATVTIAGHDAYGSHTVSDISHGDYYRPIGAGTYNLTFTSPCYQSVTVNNQSITAGQTVTLADVMLTPSGSATTPTNVGVCDIQDTAAFAYWDTTGNNYDLRYRVVGTTPWTTVNNITASEYYFSGLTLDTEYEFQTRALCGSSPTGYTSSTTFLTTGAIIPVTYCSATGNNISDEYIGKVTVNSVVNDSEASTISGYSDYTASVIFPDLEKNSTNNTIEVSKFWTGTNYADGVIAWIDYNKDGSFDDATEQVLNVAANTANPVNNTFTIPNTAAVLTGTTRMRVVLEYNTSPSSCGSFTYGEVEDYTVNITEETLSITDDVASINEISVYPNPFNNDIHMKLPSSLGNNSISVDLYDLSGRMISKLENTQAVNNTISLSNLDRLSNGTYFLRIKDNTTNKTIVRKIIK